MIDRFRRKKFNYFGLYSKFIQIEKWNSIILKYLYICIFKGI
jgi:hypothetical protein